MLWEGCDQEATQVNTPYRSWQLRQNDHDKALPMRQLSKQNEAWRVRTSHDNCFHKCWRNKMAGWRMHRLWHVRPRALSRKLELLLPRHRWNHLLHWRFRVWMLNERYNKLGDFTRDCSTSGPGKAPSTYSNHGKQARCRRSIRRRTNRKNDKLRWA